MLLAAHSRQNPTPKTTSGTILSVGLVEVVVDSTLGHLGVIAFRDCLMTREFPTWEGGDESGELSVTCLVL